MSQTNSKLFLIPLGVLIVLCTLLYTGLKLNKSNNQNDLPSPLINQPAPKFSLPSAYDDSTPFSSEDLKGHVSIVHIWATWCVACRAEYASLRVLSRKSTVPFYGIAYKTEMQEVKNWIHDFGDPYKKVGVDEKGKIGIEWGVIGTPETYIIDDKGIVRFKLLGILNYNAWQQQIVPILNDLLKNAPLQKVKP